MKTLIAVIGASLCIAPMLSAQQTRADSLRQKAIQDSIALMRALQGATAQPTQPGPSSAQTIARILPDISVVGDLVGDLSPKGSTQEDNSRIGVREVELAAQAVVDPYFRGDVFLGISDLEGIAVEQAFLTTTALTNLELRLGRYLMPFTKQNTTHRHDLHTIEYPWAIQRFLGPEGMKGTGALASKVFSPFGFYQEIQATVVDRLREAAEDLVPFEAVNKSLGGMAFAARLRNYWDLSEAANVELSGSAITGKVERGLTDANGDLIADSDVNATLGRQTMFGADLTFRWRPLQRGLYKSFIFQTEFIRQMNEASPTISAEARAAAGGATGVLASGDYNGAYAFARYQLTRRLFLGGRYDYVQDPFSDGRTLTAGSGYLQWFPSEFSKLMAGFERLNQPGVQGVNRILLQATFALGPHKPHPF
jgi:hypothetical protein